MFKVGDRVAYLDGRWSRTGTVSWVSEVDGVTRLSVMRDIGCIDLVDVKDAELL